MKGILSRLAAVSERLNSSGEVGAGRDFERELRASQPSDSTRLALQLLDERDACLARMVLAARRPGWEAVSPADVTVSPFRGGIFRLSARTAATARHSEVVFKLGSESATADASVTVL